MNIALFAGIIIVNFALISYSISIITEQKKKIITNLVLIFLFIGITLDITSTILMIIGSPNIPFTIHGILGYTALTGMLIDTLLISRYKFKNGISKVPRNLHIYTRTAYSWWIIAYIAGGLISAFVIHL